MQQLDICESTSTLSKPGRICAIDFGLKRIGIAMSNESRTLATKLKCLENNGFNQTKQFFQKLLSEYKISYFLVGYPLLLDGSEGTQCKLVHNFCIKLFDAFGIQIIKHDESYSTQRCKAITGNRKITDDVVATMFLQDFLEQFCID